MDPTYSIYIGLHEPYVRDILETLCRAQPGRWQVSAVSEAEDVSATVKELADQDPRPQLHWLEYEDLDWDRIYQSTSSSSLVSSTTRGGEPTQTSAGAVVVANAYCIRKGLIRKAQMAFQIHKYVAKHPQSILVYAVPPTFIFELDHLDYLDEALNENYEIEQALEQNEALRERAAELEPESESESAVVLSSTVASDPVGIQRFIMKPSLTARGAGIHIFDSREGFEHILSQYYSDDESDDDSDDDEEEEEEADEQIESSSDEDHQDGDATASSLGLGLGSAMAQGSQIREWVIQSYVDRPLLLNGGRKFHIRAYVVAVGGIRVYLWEDMLSLFAGTPYHAAPLDDSGAHLTNTCLQMDRPDFDESKVVKRFWDLANSTTTSTTAAAAAGETTLAEVTQALASTSLATATPTVAGDAIVTPAQLTSIFDQIKAILADLFDAVTSETTTFQARANCFELFGFDFLVDADFRTYLLEANAFPDFKQTGTSLKPVVEGLFKATLALVDQQLTQLARSGTDQQDLKTPPRIPAKMHCVYDRTLARLD
ncbi:tubulin--tyrosine ligase [Dimargaris cristalligena]|nr:tubulin--tyrosine ligase [Dimargaris cristalligena]